MNTLPPVSGAQQSARWHYERGRTLYQAGRYRKAATAFRKAIRRAPGMPFAYLGRGLSLARLNRAQRAVRNIEKAMVLAAESGHFENAPWLAQAAFEGARAYERLGQRYMALRLYTKALESSPENVSTEFLAEALRHRGRVHLRLKHYEPALHDLNQALEADANLAMAYFNRASVYEAQRHTQAAIEDLRAFLLLADPEDPHREEAKTRLEMLTGDAPS